MKNYYPKMYEKDVFSIDYNYLKKLGIKCLLIDLDNTLAKATDTLPNKKILKLKIPFYQCYVAPFFASMVYLSIGILWIQFNSN